MNKEYIHVYYGSSFNPKEKWVTKFWYHVEFSESRDEAIEKAIKIWKGLLIKFKIYVHEFGKSYPDSFIITRIKIQDDSK